MTGRDKRRRAKQKRENMAKVSNTATVESSSGLIPYGDMRAVASKVRTGCQPIADAAVVSRCSNSGMVATLPTP